MRLEEDSRLVASVSIGVDERTLPTFADELRSALEVIQLANRRTAAYVGVGELRLQRRRDVSRLMPGLNFHIATCAGGRVRPGRRIVHEFSQKGSTPVS